MDEYTTLRLTFMQKRADCAYFNNAFKRIDMLWCVNELSSLFRRNHFLIYYSVEQLQVKMRPENRMQ